MALMVRKEKVEEYYKLLDEFAIKLPFEKKYMNAMDLMFYTMLDEPEYEGIKNPNNHFLKEFTDPIKLGKDIMEHGTYWFILLTTIDDKPYVAQGNHRVDSLRELYKAGGNIDKWLFTIKSPEYYDFSHNKRLIRDDSKAIIYPIDITLPTDFLNSFVNNPHVKEYMDNLEKETKEDLTILKNIDNGIELLDIFQYYAVYLNNLIFTLRQQGSYIKTSDFVNKRF